MRIAHVIEVDDGAPRGNGMRNQEAWVTFVVLLCNFFTHLLVPYFYISAHQILALVASMTYHDLLCFGRPGLQADNVMYRHKTLG